MTATFAMDTRLHPIQAWRALRLLLEQPEDTGQVFVVLRALRGRSGVRLLRRFAASPAGAAILRDRRSLLARLQDRDGLALLPDGSLGRAYLDFMTTEQLSADSLVRLAEPELRHVPDDAAFLRRRMRDMHDLLHVVTGHDRTPLGELCLMAFNHAQNGHAGMGLIALGGMRRARGSRRLIVRAWLAGRRAAWLAGQDWEAMLARPMDGLRRELGIDIHQYSPGSAMSDDLPRVETVPPPAGGRRVPAGLLGLGRSVLINIVGPTLLYRVVAHWFADGSVAPLLICSAIPVVDLVAVYLRRRSLDVIALISLVQLGVSIVITLVSGSAEMALTAHALQAGALGCVFAISALLRRPLIQALARQTIAGDDPEKQARFDILTRRPATRRVFAWMTVFWAVGLWLQSAVLVVGARRLSAADYITLHAIVSYGMNGAMIWACVRYGRRRAAAAHRQG